MSATPDDSSAMTDELNDALLKRYLVDTCTEEEKVRVEDHVFAQGPVYERLREIEEDLIDRHLRGQLAGPEREQFERAYASPPRRQRILFAQSLKAVLAEERRPVRGDLPQAEVASAPAAARGTTGRKPSFRETMTASFNFRLAFAGAALLLLAAVVAWRSDVAQVRSTLARAEADNQALRQQRAADRLRVEELEKRAAADEEPGRMRTPIESPPGARPSRSVIATFVLTPGLVRAGRAPARLLITPAAGSVRLQLDLEPGIDHRGFRVELRNSESRVLWSQDTRPVQADSAAVVITVPAALLETGEYEVVLFGVLDGGGREDAGHYYFDVAR